MPRGVQDYNIIRTQSRRRKNMLVLAAMGCTVRVNRPDEEKFYATQSLRSDLYIKLFFQQENYSNYNEIYNYIYRYINNTTRFVLAGFRALLSPYMYIV